MNEISIEAIFLKHAASLISEALDELNINGAISGVFPKGMIKEELQVEHFL